MRHLNIAFLFILMFFSFLLGCAPDRMNIKDTQSYLRNDKNGICKVIQKNGLRLEAFILRPELVFNTTTKKNTQDSLRYFLLSFSKDGKEALPQVANPNQYANILNNLSFNVAQYCRVIENGRDTLNVNNSSFLNTYGTSASNSLLVVFHSSNPLTECTLELDEIGFGIGQHKMEFKKKDIEKFYNIEITQ